ncbi:hypothetical protein EBZ38_04795 [bacterium]|nr:hypothetical protein [bacterium]
MAVTTVDVITNSVPNNETIKNGTIVVNCYRTGAYNISNTTYQKAVTYEAVESKYTSRFDDLGYYYHSLNGGNP